MAATTPDRPKDPFTAALVALRSALRGGRFSRGEPLTITELAHDLSLSATPVREALSRLAGEGLIEDRRGRGYFARRLDVADLVELYGLRGLYLGEALNERHGQGQTSLEPTSGAAHERLAWIMDRLVAQAGNRALFDAYRSICDRLGPATDVEPQLFRIDEELAAIEAAEPAGQPALSLVLDRLHADRRARADELVRAIRARANIATL